MINQKEQFQEGEEKICNYIWEKPYKYKPLIEGSFGIVTPSEEGRILKGFGVNIGFLFSEAVCPEQMSSNLKRFKIVKDVAQAESLDLIGLETPTRAVRYREQLPLNSLAIGYVERLPTFQEIDKIFTAYDTIEAKLKE